MAVNPVLAQLRGISEEDVLKIESIHHTLEGLIKDAICTGRDCGVILDEIAGFEYMLQELWGFTLDNTKHTWNKRYLFKRQWAFTIWECIETGEQFTIPYNVEECDFFVVGKGFVDVGRWGSYSRFSGVIGIEKD